MLFNMYKIRYVEMNKLLDGMGKGSAQIFINLEPILRRLYKADAESYLKVNYKKRMYEFVSNILNLAAHYRKFFSSQGRDTEVVIYLPDWARSYTNAMVVKGYRDNNDDKIFNETTVFGRFVKDCIELTTTIVEYIEGVYILRTNVIEPSLVPELVRNNMTHKILITTDRYEYQYANRGFIILRPKKSGQSYVMTNVNIVGVMKTEDKIVSDEHMPPSFIPLALSFMGDTTRSIPKVKGVGLYKIIKMVNDGIKGGFITESTDNIRMMDEILVDDLKETIHNNYTVTDINSQLRAVPTSVVVKLRQSMTDRFDNVSLKKLNQLFIESPIMLTELMPLKERPSVFKR